MHFATTVALVGLTAHHASATFGHGSWNIASQYSTPDNTDNKCSDNQKTGYNWADLNKGSFNDYGSNKFTGWSCTDSFGKRDLLTKRSFQDKCISSNLDDEPSIGCNGDDSMSIDKYQVSSSEDADIECHYEMPDKSVCKEYHSCKAGGTEIQNSQCGGAKSVTFKPAESYKGKGCSIGVHSIEFNCGTASTKVPGYASSTEAVSSSTPGVDSTTSSQAPVETTSCVEGYGSSCDSTSSSEVVQTTESIATYVSSASSSSESSPVTTSESVSSYSSSTEVMPVESVPAYGSSGSSESSPVTATAPVYSTSVAYNSSITYSVPAYPPSSSSIASNSVPSSTTSNVGVPSSSASSPSKPPAYPPPSTPELLPRCLNTWLYTVECKDNTDYSCFCKNSDFINKVYGCLSSWSPSADNTTNGVSYLMGLCAPYIPENPAIVTGCPSIVTPAVYTPPPAPSASSPVTQDAPPPTPPASLPCTTITYSSEIVVPVTYPTGTSQGSPIPSSSSTKTIITTVTVPQVQITTYTVTESGSTVTVPDLGYGAPPSTPEATPSQPQPALTTDSGPAPAPPYVTSTSTLVVGPVDGSSGFVTSPAATSAQTGVVTYQGAGSKKAVGGFLGTAVAVCAYLFVM